MNSSISGVLKVVRTRGAAAVTAVLLLINTLFSFLPASADQFRELGFSVRDFCENKVVGMRRLGPVLRARAGVPQTDSRYDDIVSGVILRMLKDCEEGKVPDALADQEARLNTYIRNSRIDAQRRVKQLAFTEEIFEPAEST